MPDETLRTPLPGGEVPDPMELFQDTFKEFSDDMMPYLLAGLGQMVVLMPLMILMFIVLYFTIIGSIFGGMFIGVIAAVMAAETLGEEAAGLVIVITYLLMFVVMFALIFGLSAFMGALMAPLNASMMRRVAKHQRGEQTLDFGASFSDAKENLLPTMLVTVITSLIVLVGIMFCYAPGIIAAFILMYAGSLVYLHRESPMAAVKISGSHFIEHIQFHGLYSLLYFAGAMVASYVPILGPMFLTALHVRAHRTLFGDGEAAVLEPRIIEAS